MNKYWIYEALLIASLITACHREDMETPESSATHSITASVVGVTPITSRMTDNDTQTTFENGDAIRIAWSGLSVPFQYTYTGAENLFVPKTDDDKKLWGTLIVNEHTDVDVYAWYGFQPIESGMPTVGTVLSIQPNQNTGNGFTNSFFLSAHQQVQRTAKNLNFDFKHLVAYLKIDLESKDGTITQEDILSSVIAIKGIHHQGTVTAGTTGEWSLVPMETDVTTLVMMNLNSSWSVERPYEISHQCYVIPQKLTSDNQISITLKSGKVFVCSLPSELELKAGDRATLSVTLASGAGYEIIPTVHIFKDAYNSSYSGNRILSAVKTSAGAGDEYGFLVYDKQSDGSWRTSSVYEDEDGTTLFPKGQDEFYKTRGVTSVDMYGDYGVVGYGSDPGNRLGTFFIKKSKTTGNWYVGAGPLKLSGYAVAINQNLLLSGGNSENRETYAYVIDDNGEISNTAGTDIKINGFKLNLAENGILVGHNGVYRLSIENGIPKAENLNVPRLTRNKMATDGYKVIAMIDNSSSDKNTLIYNLDTKEFEQFTEYMVAGDGRPVGIYDRYALIGYQQSALVLFYFNDDGKWEPIGDKINGKTDPQSFLKLAQKYNPALNDVTRLTGTSVFLKGTRAMVSSEGVTYFIEYIDQMVKDWLDGQSAVTTD